MRRWLSAVGNWLSAVGCRLSVNGERAGWSALALALLLAAPVAAQAPLAARDIARGETLAAADIVRADSAPADGRQPTADSSGGVAEGWVTRRAIRAGEPLRPPAVAPPPLVRAGQAVQALWRFGAVELRIRGTALSTAAEGERVAVRLETRRRVEGVAVGAGVVRVGS